ncbi:hypothetical protein FACS1894164_10950 [Spirochaetia bacterium]|nr:hypothetical protein FACS1894164_10950 [Spirochaetia bacterium]
MNLLLDELPVTCEGVPFNFDFKAVLRFMKTMEDPELNEMQKALSCITIFFNGQAPSSENVWGFIKDFIAGPDHDEDSDRGVKSFDWEIDSGRIYSSFLQAYAIDLRTSALHWWIFLQLLSDLPDDTILKKIMNIRQEKPKKGKEWAEYNATLAKLQNKYRLNTLSLDDFL